MRIQDDYLTGLSAQRCTFVYDFSTVCLLAELAVLLAGELVFTPLADFWTVERRRFSPHSVDDFSCLSEILTLR